MTKGYLRASGMIQFPGRIRASSGRQSACGRPDGENCLAITGNVALVNHRRIGAEVVLELGLVANVCDGAARLIGPAKATELHLEGAARPFHDVRRKSLDRIFAIDGGRNDLFVAETLQIVLATRLGLIRCVAAVPGAIVRSAAPGDQRTDYKHPQAAQHLSRVGLLLHHRCATLDARRRLVATSFPHSLHLTNATNSSDQFSGLVAVRYIRTVVRGI